MASNYDSNSPGNGRSVPWPQVLVLFIGMIVLLGVMFLNRPAAPIAAQEDLERRVFFRQPTAYAIVPPAFTVRMGAEGLIVEPAGEAREDAGHFHLLVDTDFVPAGDVIPRDEAHLHFGDASDLADLVLEPGPHVLRLQFANGLHEALEGDAFRDEIVVYVNDAAAEQSVRFVTPTDGAIVPETFTVVLAATGVAIDPAGEIIEGSGHFHILVDQPFLEAGEVVPAGTEGYIHLGRAQREAELTLAPGPHVLRLQLADAAHTVLAGEQFRDEITVNVVEGAPEATVVIVEPEDGAMVNSPFEVSWAATGVIVEPAGPAVREGAGHLHLLIDEPFVEAGAVIPRDETHLHFGGGQLGTVLDLPPGTYTLRLQLADAAHTALEGDSFRDEVTVTVAE